MNSFMPGLFTVGALAMALMGCASTTPVKESQHSLQELYDGQLGVAHEAGRSDTTADEAISRGDRALEEGDHDKALYEYVKALTINADDSEMSRGDAATLKKIGAIHAEQGNFLMSARAYAISLRLDPRDAEVLEAYGLVLVKQRKFDDAKLSLEAALAVEPGRWQAHNGLGVIADLEGDYAQAVQHYRQALQVNPKSPAVLNNFGYSLYLRGDWDDAMEAFYQSARHDVHPKRVWYNIALIHVRRGRYVDAMRALRQVMDWPESYNTVGYLCMINGDYEAASRFLQKAIDQSPSYYVKAHENLERLRQLKLGDRG